MKLWLYDLSLQFAYIDVAMVRCYAMVSTKGVVGSSARAMKWVGVTTAGPGRIAMNRASGLAASCSVGQVAGVAPSSSTIGASGGAVLTVVFIL